MLVAYVNGSSGQKLTNAFSRINRYDRFCFFLFIFLSVFSLSVGFPALLKLNHVSYHVAIFF